jgi:hypothetical protein
VPATIRGRRPGELSDGVSEVGLVDDVVTVEDRPCLVAGQRHRHLLWHAGADQIPNRRAAEIVRKAAGAAGDEGLVLDPLLAGRGTLRVGPGEAKDATEGRQCPFASWSESRWVDGMRGILENQRRYACAVSSARRAGSWPGPRENRTNWRVRKGLPPYRSHADNARVEWFVVEISARRSAPEPWIGAVHTKQVSPTTRKEDRWNHE